MKAPKMAPMSVAKNAINGASSLMSGTGIIPQFCTGGYDLAQSHDTNPQPAPARIAPINNGRPLGFLFRIEIQQIKSIEHDRTIASPRSRRIEPWRPVVI